ncbi:hypothetical protein [Alloactinosynnema sp. L-07]|uniref:hypothetical protein n=1 Tax=Alloactinosynnema sp. L-07 TaxID=1653480 RepID=UPI00065EF5CE|nr:hypothetical protein [Alloactinosynnema sp. L-07]CRK57721.1 hypothetical protein [Alloactinosynnema sp. L-07]
MAASAKFGIAGVLAIMAMVGTALPASATDVGGDGNPAVDCPNGYTVASRTIERNGQVIGTVEMRWSWACSGNWTRTTSYIGARQLRSGINTQPFDRHTYGDDYAVQNWSPYRRVAPTQSMCSYGQIIDENGYGWGMHFCV